MAVLRRGLYPLRLAVLRVLARAGRSALVGVGIAAGAAMLAAVLGGSAVAQDRSLARATSQIPPGDRAVRAIWDGIPGQNPQGYGALDRLATRSLARVGVGSPVRVTLVRERQIDRALVDLGAIDGLRRFVRVTSGRLPRTCTPARCEVVQVAGHGRIPSASGLRLVRVGHAVLTSDVPLGPLITRETNRTLLGQALRYHTPAAAPFLLADGVRGLAGAPALVDSYRSYSWVLPIRPGDVHPWTADRFAGGVTRARSNLGAASGLFDVTAPTEALLSARADAQAAGRRLLLLGGEAAALLLAFAVLAATMLRRDAEEARNRLTWSGARRWQLGVFAGAEAAAVAAFAALVGWIVGAALAAAIATRAGSPVGGVLRSSVASGGGAVAALALAAAAAAVLLATLQREGGGRVLDVAALGALGAIALAVARGGADGERLSREGGTGVLLLLLPGLVAFVAAAALARGLAPLLRRLERLGRRGPVPLRLAALSLARHSGRAAVGAGFLVVSLGFALFAGTYRSTLEAGQRDRAAYAAPLGYVLAEDLTKLVPVADVDAPPAATRALRVLRASGDVSRLEGSAFTLVGVPATAIPALHGWRGDLSALSQRELAARLAPPRPVAVRGLPVGRELRIPAATRGDNLSVTAAVVTPRGDAVPIRLGIVRGQTVLRAPVPREARGGRLVALTFGLTGTGLHGVTNGGTGVQPLGRGQLTIGLPRGGWTGEGGVRVVGGDARGTRVRYLVAPGLEARFRARQPTDAAPVPAAVTPALARAAGDDGILPLQVAGVPLRVRVVATVDRFPSAASGEIVVADAGSIAAALTARAPGTGAPNELWLDGGPQLARQLARPPYTALSVVSRTALESELRGDPLARGVLLALAAASLAALALALAGLELGLVADLRDEGGELFDLEAQGAPPAALRRHLRLRSLVVAGAGLVGGTLVGAILAAVVVAFVGLTANAGDAQPPLALAIDWPLVVVALLAYAALAAVLVSATTARAFDADAPERRAETAA